ncbi:MAG: hypothetical protein V3R96_06145, partial [Dehalococcoidales bacterium]
NIYLTRQKNGLNGNSKYLGNINTNKEPAMEIIHGQELLEPDYFYHGLKTIEEGEKTTLLIECLDDMLVKSRLYYSLAIFSRIQKEKIIEYYAGLSQPFCADDQRSHLYIFPCKKITLAVTMRFAEGDQPIDVHAVNEADRHPHKLKRMLLEENLHLSEKCSLSPSPGESGDS